jgi:cell division protease FtsH
MITQYGMSAKLGPRTFGEHQDMIFLGREITEQRDYGDKIADVIDEEVYGVIQEAYETARRILTENRSRLEYLSNLLMVKEGLEGKDLEKAFTDPLNGKKKVTRFKKAAQTAPDEKTATGRSESKKSPSSRKPGASTGRKTTRTGPDTA